MLLLLLCTLLAACAGPPDSKAARADESGRQSPSAVPQRIVSLVPATTEMLFAIGAGDRVVGIGTYDRFPPEAASRPRVGALLDPDTERILGLQPDLVVLYHTQMELREQLERANVPYYSYSHQTLSDVMETIRALGARVGDIDEAERLASEMEREIDAVRRSSEGRPRPSVLLVFGREPGSLRNIHASGGYGFLADLVTIAGGNNVLADAARESVQVGTEMLLQLGPEVIIELEYGAAGPGRRSAADWQPLAALPAVRSGRIHVLTGDEFVVPGPRVVEALRRIASIIQDGPAVDSPALQDNRQ